MTNYPTVVFWALAGGILPALVWLLFWLREDRKHPEPKGLIALAFIAGMIAVLLVLPFEMITASLVAPFEQFFYGLFSQPLFLTFLIWAFLEETFKYVASYITVLRRKEMNEPVDAAIYLITTALGFSALENAFFLLQPFLNGDWVGGVVSGNFRFIGASLLHVIASATVGMFVGMAFYKGKSARRMATLWGLVCAIILHALFNLFIIENSGAYTFVVFASVWVLVIVLMLFFQKIKKVRRVTL
ncbi:MAG: PrsW family glutamic-type intramembrane protease [Patescibacteria group bacterium]